MTCPDAGKPSLTPKNDLPQYGKVIGSTAGRVRNTTKNPRLQKEAGVGFTVSGLSRLMAQNMDTFLPRLRGPAHSGAKQGGPNGLTMPVELSENR